MTAAGSQLTERRSNIGALFTHRYLQRGRGGGCGTDGIDDMARRERDSNGKQ